MGGIWGGKRISAGSRGNANASVNTKNVWFNSNHLQKRSLCPRSPRILFTLHCLSVWIATQSHTLRMFSVSLTRLSQPMPHHMCRLIKQAIFLGADSRPMTINISASSFRISSGFIKYLNPSVLWAQSKQRANQRTTTDID